MTTWFQQHLGVAIHQPFQDVAESAALETSLMVQEKVASMYYHLECERGNWKDPFREDNILEVARVPWLQPQLQQQSEPRMIVQME